MSGDMRPLYEAHITYDLVDRTTVEASHSPEWKFSAIDGDPVLGAKTFCYLTSYDSDAGRLLERMRMETAAVVAVAIAACRKEPFPVRLKVERIVYDSKTHRDEVTSAETVG